MLANWFQNRRRRRLLADPFPDDWLATLRSSVRHYRYLPAGQQQRTREIVQVMLAEKEWAGAAGFEVTEPMCVTIAGVAAMMVSGADPPYFFDELQTIVVHPRTVRFTPEQSRNPWMPEAAVDGVAWHHGPVLLSWAAVRQEQRGRAPGRNVVVHEFAHHLDGLAGTMDGAPGQRNAEADRQWYAVTEAEFLRLVGNARRGEATVLDYYGASNQAEFFAVASECFFELPHAMHRRHRELYDALAGFYQQSPVEWLPLSAVERELETPAAERGAAKPREATDAAYDVRGLRPQDRARLKAFRAMSAGDALFALGLQHLDEQRFEDAARIFTQLVEADPSDEESLAHRALAYLNLARLSEAQADCDAALAIDPYDVDALCVRAEICLGEDRPQEAIDDLNEALAESPNDMDARYLRGRAHLALGRPRRAISDLNRAIQADEHFADALYQRGRAYQMLGRQEQAQRDLRRARLLEPNGDWPD
jgi:Mlc titration factor MtfA (ptsG expression regulator)/Tfp pilus assembly protein PilF